MAETPEFPPVLDATDAAPVNDTPQLPISDQARILEAVLFAAPEPMSAQALRDAIPGDCDLGAALTELQALYDGRGIALREIDGKWAFRTSDLVASHLYQFRREEKKLSRAALETLAIIAYHQPVTRPEIENIRGVAISKGTIDILMELGWVKPGKRRDIPGRPLTWITTTSFLDHFGLEKLNDLPGMEDLKASGLLDTRPAIETIDMFSAEDAELKEDAGVDDAEPVSDDEQVDFSVVEEEITIVASTEDIAEADDLDESDDDEAADDTEDDNDDDSDDDDDIEDDYDEDDDDDDEDDDDDDEGEDKE